MGVHMYMFVNDVCVDMDIHVYMCSHVHVCELVIHCLATVSKKPPTA